MSKSKFICLLIAAGQLLALSVISASAETNETNETNQLNTTSLHNETQLLEQELSLNINLLISMLQMLDLNLYLINETLNAHLEEYPFLKPTIEGTEEGIKAVDSILATIKLSPDNNLSDTNVTPGSLHETMSLINSSLEYPDGMIGAANSTMGEPNITTPMIVDMYKSVKTMSSLLNKF
jgi:hypothetical protein